MRGLPSDMKLAVLYSGGKDSNYAMYTMMKAGHEIQCLLTVRPSSVESMLFHYPNVWHTDLQSESLGIPLLANSTRKGEDELDSLSDLVERALSSHEIEGVVTGGVKSEYQKGRFEKVFTSHGLIGVNPLWGIDEQVYLRELVMAKFKVIITRVAAQGLGPEWLGVELDLERIERLLALAKKNRFNPSFEGGEGETFVLDMPFFRKEILVVDAEKTWEKDEGTLNIKKATLRDKSDYVREDKRGPSISY